MKMIAVPWVNRTTGVEHLAGGGRRRCRSTGSWRRRPRCQVDLDAQLSICAWSGAMSRCTASDTWSRVTEEVSAEDDSTELAIATRATTARSSDEHEHDGGREAARQDRQPADDPGDDGVKQERQHPRQEEHREDGEERLDHVRPAGSRPPGSTTSGSSITVQRSAIRSCKCVRSCHGKRLERRRHRSERPVAIILYGSHHAKYSPRPNQGPRPGRA